MKTKKFILRDSTAGNEIEDYNSLEEAQKCIELFEIQDKNAGIMNQKGLTRKIIISDVFILVNKKNTILYRM